jgi:hypothetical protein
LQCRVPRIWQTVAIYGTVDTNDPLNSVFCKAWSAWDRAILLCDPALFLKPNAIKVGDLLWSDFKDCFGCQHWCCEGAVGLSFLLVVMVVALTGCRHRMVVFFLVAVLDCHMGCNRDVEEWSSLLSTAMPLLQKNVSMVVGDAHLMETCRVLEDLRLGWDRGLFRDFILVLAGLGLLVLASNLR